ISFGVRGYAEMYDTFHPTVRALSPFEIQPVLHRYSFGPTVEVSLPRAFAVQLDALRSRLEVREGSSFFAFSNPPIEDFRSDTVGHSWQFPFIVKRNKVAG